MKIKEIRLEREYFLSSVNGSLFVDDEYICKTIELPWLDNFKRRSCIPEGRYEVQPRFSQKFGWHYILENVPNRDLILIHPANNALKELMGCIAPVSVLTGQGIGSSSKKAMDRLYLSLAGHAPNGQRVFITIQNKDGREPYKFF